MDIDIPPEQFVTQNMAAYGDQKSHPIGLPGDTSAPLHHRDIGGFFLDKGEVNLGDWIRFYPAITAGEDAELPATRFSYDQAIAVAEWYGKRLQTEHEYEVAATNEGATPYPWGNLEDVRDTGWPLGPVGVADYDVNRKGVKGLYSNVVEMTETWALFYPPQKTPEFQESPFAREGIVCRGAPDLNLSLLTSRETWKPGPAVRVMTAKVNHLEATLGARFAKSQAPRFSLGRTASNP